MRSEWMNESTDWSHKYHVCRCTFIWNIGFLPLNFSSAPCRLSCSPESEITPFLQLLGHFVPLHSASHSALQDGNLCMCEALSLPVPRMTLMASKHFQDTLHVLTWSLRLCVLYPLSLSLEIPSTTLYSPALLQLQWTHGGSLHYVMPGSASGPWYLLFPMNSIHFLPSDRLFHWLRLLLRCHHLWKFFPDQCILKSMHTTTFICFIYFFPYHTFIWLSRLPSPPTKMQTLRGQGLCYI